MRHIDHCFHCGTAMRNLECPNSECRTENSTLPVWPWDICQQEDCHIRAFQIMSRWQLFRQCWMVAIGALFLLIGFVALSFKLKILGFVLILGWFGSRSLFQLSRSVNFKLFKKENKRTEDKRKYDEGFLEDTAENRKRLKDNNDKIRALEYKIFGHNILRKVLSLTVLILVFGVFLTYLPDTGLQQKKSVLQKSKEQISEALSSDLLSNLVEDAKERLDWKQNKIKFVYNKAMNRGMSYEQCEKIEKLIESQGGGALDKCVEILQKTNLNNQELYHKLANTFQNNQGKKKEKVSDNSSSEPKRSSMLASIGSGIKYYFDTFYLESWLFLLLMEIGLVLVWMILSGMGIFMLGLSKAYEFGDEAWDKAKLMFEKAMDKRGESRATETSSSGSEGTNSSSESSIWSSEDVWGSLIGSAGVEIVTGLISKLGRR